MEVRALSVPAPSSCRQAHSERAGAARPNRMGGEEMEDRHLSLVTLARLATGRIEVEELQQLVIPHLIGVCAGCREIHRELQRLKQEVGHWDEMVAVLEGLDAPDLWHRLEPRPYTHQLRQVEGDGGFQTWALCRPLLRKGLHATLHRPRLAVQPGFPAVNIACPPSRPPH